ncbi:hypothetical protein BU14_0077s0036 [Porphyra umbilicalis]|uniref:GB1/RHD3-type G domain-containing protein n=1 Tax=Porphyra umbilicalis TaxID=2786 RepID=A0A1X6PFA0_PORUM|nr:hypothetical protein BU14_0077s0036 [Porphyra umbilicalis]|eukprot:OSX79416.1 hypothetical protein BU14_0077s0036 [Porphyra umbilicalis]
MSGVVQVIDGEGQMTDAPTWFDDDAERGPDAPTVVAILGAQGSGKSTLLNELFDTSFAVGDAATIGEATTAGVAAAKASADERLLVLDVEGADARSRGAAGRAFASRCASFAAALADVVLLNLWYHDVGRVEASSYALLKTLFAEVAKNVASGGDFRVAVVFVIRDVEPGVDADELRDLLVADAMDLWEGLKMDDAGPMQLEDHVDFSVVPLPHKKHEGEAFAAATAAFGDRLVNPDHDDFLPKPEYSKNVPADGFATFSRSLWDASYADSHGADRDGAEVGADGEGGALEATFRCDEMFSEVLQSASREVSELSRQLDGGEKIPSLGAKLEELIAHAGEIYEAGTEAFVDAPVHSRKRRELDAVVDTMAHTVFVKQLQAIRESCLAAFKTTLASDDMPPDFAFFSADSQFVREAEAAKFGTAGWTYAAERQDLQGLMQEITAQRRRLTGAKAAAQQQQASAMQYLQMQQAQMQALQQQQFGGGIGQWNVNAAYRPPDTNVNVALGYAAGKTNLQVNMVPDESSSLAGPNGFTAGITPANLGLSFNVNM